MGGRHPDAAETLYQLAESHAQQDTSFLTEVAFTRLRAEEALRQLRKQGVSDEHLPAAGTMAKCSTDWVFVCAQW